MPNVARRIVDGKGIRRYASTIGCNEAREEARERLGHVGWLLVVPQSRMTSTIASEPLREELAIARDRRGLSLRATRVRRWSDREALTRKHSLSDTKLANRCLPDLLHRIQINDTQDA